MLLARVESLAALHTAADSAARGHGRVVLLPGEAGIGKTSVVRTFLDGLDGRVRVLFGACDDLLAPRALGPLRDAAGTGGPLERALDGPTDAVFGAAVAQLSVRTVDHHVAASSTRSGCAPAARPPRPRGSSTSPRGHRSTAELAGLRPGQPVPIPDEGPRRSTASMTTSVATTAVARAAVRVRPARDDDLPAIREVLRAAYRPYAAVLPVVLFELYLADVLDVRSRTAAGVQLVAELEGRVVGTVTHYPSARDDGHGWPPGWAGLRVLAAHPEARGLGVGRLLTTECRDRASAAGAPALALHTATFMRSAVALYERLGFRRVPGYDFEAGTHFGATGVRPLRVPAYRLDLAAPAEIGSRRPSTGRAMPVG